MISVLVVDDSAFMRKMITEILAEDPALRVIGQAYDGEDALNKLALLKPDVITLDVEMPRLDGLDALEQIMKRRPTPTVMLSSRTQAGAETTLRCLERGAVDFIAKPSGTISLDIRLIAAELVSKVKAAAGVRASRLMPRSASLSPALSLKGDEPPASRATQARERTHRPGVLVIGASTGGPRALQTLVPALPAHLPVPAVIVQHMPSGFTASLARRLDDASPLCVREAIEGDPLRPGVVLVAPGGHHLMFDAHGAARLTDEPPIHGVRPAVDVTVASLAKLYGPRVVAVLLTGMGRDGARGLKTVSDGGGHTLAEDETTCVVYGMPKAAAEMGAVHQLLPLGQLADAVASLFEGGRLS
jgi:two-component system chemotaxis response regulator CheB